jgi:hypothetical protein
MKLSKSTLSKPTAFHVMRGPDDDFDHRAEVIRLVCDFELLVTEKALDWLTTHNPRLDREAARKEFFVDGPISSLKKLADLAHVVGVIGPQTRHDLRKFSQMRDRYAHDRKRGQLGDDPEMFSHLTNTYAYRENRDVLSQDRPYAVLLQLSFHLEEVIEAGHYE